jgi:hypothetical protein
MHTGERRRAADESETAVSQQNRSERAALLVQRSNPLSSNLELRISTSKPEPLDSRRLREPRSCSVARRTRTRGLLSGFGPTHLSHPGSTPLPLRPRVLASSFSRGSVRTRLTKRAVPALAIASAWASDREARGVTIVASRRSGFCTRTNTFGRCRSAVCYMSRPANAAAC